MTLTHSGALSIFLPLPHPLVPSPFPLPLALIRLFFFEEGKTRSYVGLMVRGPSGRTLGKDAALLGAGLMTHFLPTPPCADIPEPGACVADTALSVLSSENPPGGAAFKLDP